MRELQCQGAFILSRAVVQEDDTHPFHSLIRSQSFHYTAPPVTVPLLKHHTSLPSPKVFSPFLFNCLSKRRTWKGIKTSSSRRRSKKRRVVPQDRCRITAVCPFRGADDGQHRSD
ncbi:hypothetical protein GW17_00059228 [Ensete ventricosum]|nr:hypothetical protein GW17_00059228 [Ensete ventricosum]